METSVISRHLHKLFSGHSCMYLLPCLCHQDTLLVRIHANSMTSVTLGDQSVWVAYYKARLHLRC